MQKSLSFITLFKALNLVMEFVVFIAFSLQFSAPENPSVHPVMGIGNPLRVTRPSCWRNSGMECVGLLDERGTGVVGYQIDEELCKKATVSVTCWRAG